MLIAGREDLDKWIYAALWVIPPIAALIIYPFVPMTYVLWWMFVSTSLNMGVNVSIAWNTKALSGQSDRAARDLASFHEEATQGIEDINDFTASLHSVQEDLEPLLKLFRENRETIENARERWTPIEEWISERWPDIQEFLDEHGETYVHYGKTVLNRLHELVESGALDALERQGRPNPYDDLMDESEEWISPEGDDPEEEEPAPIPELKIGSLLQNILIPK